jgi:hypothetical protein
MRHFLTSDDKYRDQIYSDDYREYLITRSQSADDYRFGRSQRRRTRVHARKALRHVSGYFRTMIEAIANAKVRRMERELELRGIRLDRSNNDWVAPKLRPTEPGR